MYNLVEWVTTIYSTSESPPPRCVLLNCNERMKSNGVIYVSLSNDISHVTCCFSTYKVIYYMSVTLALELKTYHLVKHNEGFWYFWPSFFLFFFLIVDILVSSIHWITPCQNVISQLIRMFLIRRFLLLGLFSASLTFDVDFWVLFLPSVILFILVMSFHYIWILRCITSSTMYMIVCHCCFQYHE